MDYGLGTAIEPSLLNHKTKRHEKSITIKYNFGFHSRLQRC